MALRFALPLLFLPAILASPLAAQTPGPFGTWILTAVPDLTPVIETATASMNFVTRPIARARLKKATLAFQTIRIDRGPDDIGVQYEQRTPQRMPADGRAVEWTREDGEKMQISARMDQDDLVQHYQAADGERTNVFHVDPRTRTMTLGVTIISPHLPAPLSFSLTYRQP
jgi:hypothetical protein